MEKTGQDKSLHRGVPSPTPHTCRQSDPCIKLNHATLLLKALCSHSQVLPGSKPNSHPWFYTDYNSWLLLSSHPLPSLCPSRARHAPVILNAFLFLQHNLCSSAWNIPPLLSPGKLLLIHKALAEMAPPP